MAEEERWVPMPIDGFEDAYYISDRGRVKSQMRLVEGEMRTLSGHSYRHIKRRYNGNRLLKPKFTHHGYHQFKLSKDGRSVMAYAHRLVLLAFDGPPPEGCKHAAHLNGKRTDNRIENLMWATPVENMSHKADHGTLHGRPSRRGLKGRAAAALLACGFSPAQIAYCLNIKTTWLDKYAVRHQFVPMVEAPKP